MLPNGMLPYILSSYWAGAAEESTSAAEESTRASDSGAAWLKSTRRREPPELTGGNDEGVKSSGKGIPPPPAPFVPFQKKLTVPVVQLNPRGRYEQPGCRFRVHQHGDVIDLEPRFRVQCSFPDCLYEADPAQGFGSYCCRKCVVNHGRGLTG